jgi:hypothetical protein
MSALDKGPDTVIVHHAEQYTSPDGNIMYRLSTTDIDPVPLSRVQVAAQSGTSARRAEQDNEGYETEDVYRWRPPRSYTRAINPASQVEWAGLMWNILGNPKNFHESPRTAHRDFVLRRT